METRECLGCGGSFYGNSNGRPAIWCSRKCKDKVKHQERRAAAVAARGERRCPVCENVIPDTVTLKAVCCSRECGVTHQNRVRAAAKLERLRELDRKCERCGEPIPVERHGATKFCTTKCKQLAHAAVWRARSPGYMRQYAYGITPNQFAKMLADQNNCCAICGTFDWGGKSGAPHVDHCHSTGEIRGLLCANCNNGLGMFKDDPVSLRAAADYLERRS